ncbi:unnamed protein product [Macrosiphum euphorbiae]|uniref:Uncharacterized protein n=1 Tax=Macrosiphum euphorbiae TaxID=13131 RepID=A0AAV0X194_9HEMI|nr:unnamed protein product [Macrosiphum euphorbiae]
MQQKQTSTTHNATTNTFMKFENYERTKKHPFALYADFESFLVKQNNSNNTRNTCIIHDHDLMSYCYYIKPSEDIPIELLNKYNISTKPVMFRGDSSFGQKECCKEVHG